jgi:hypothetical protein
MTTATIDAEADLLAWTGFLRRHHQRLNAHHFGGRLAEPTIEWADLDDGTNATFGYRQGAPVLRFSRATIDGRPFLGDAYATKLATARLAESLTHELCHQAAAEVYDQQPTGDQAADHRGLGVPRRLRYGRHRGPPVQR